LRNAHDVADKIVRAFEHPFRAGELTLTATTSIGIAVFREDGQEPETLWHRADAALYVAKHAGRNRWCRWSLTR